MISDHCLLQFFQYDHLPAHLAAVSKPFCDLAHQIDVEHCENSEKTECLRKLLEAKDCAVRSAMLSKK